MGQQQLLLLVVGIIIVAVAVVIGINQFSSASDTAKVDNVTQAMQHIGTVALSYYEKPASYGGGEGTFTGFVMPSGLASVPGCADIVSTPSINNVLLTCTDPVLSFTVDETGVNPTP